MKIGIFSDLHIPNRPSQRATHFVEALRYLRKQEKISKLWLLGDIFDLLVGNFNFWRKLHQPIFHELKELQRSGCEILWLEGNHDFHMLEIANLVGAEVRDGPQILDLGKEKKKVYLAHGDLVNTADEAYMRWRAFTRNPYFRKSISLIPEAFAESRLRGLAEKISATSRNYSARHDNNLIDLYRNFARNRFYEGFDAVFMGHCHEKDLFEQGRHFYLNLGSWLGTSMEFAVWQPKKDSPPKIFDAASLPSKKKSELPA